MAAKEMRFFIEVDVESRVLTINIYNHYLID